LDAAITMAFEALATPPKAAETEVGYHSLLAGGGGLVPQVVVGEETLTLDFPAADLRGRGLQNLSTGSTFLEQVLRTTFSFKAVTRVALSLDGDCAAFWQALGGEGCHVLTRDNLQERQS
jgi:hypothetical protein